MGSIAFSGADVDGIGDPGFGESGAVLANREKGAMGSRNFFENLKKTAKNPPLKLFKIHTGIRVNRIKVFYSGLSSRSLRLPVRQGLWFHARLFNLIQVAKVAKENKNRGFPHPNDPPTSKKPSEEAPSFIKNTGFFSSSP